MKPDSFCTVNLSTVNFNTCNDCTHLWQKYIPKADIFKAEDIKYRCKKHDFIVRSERETYTYICDDFRNKHETRTIENEHVCDDHKNIEKEK